MGAMTGRAGTSRGQWISGGVFCALFAAASVVAEAQTLEERGFRPVDQIIEDTDPLRTSLRHLDAGLQTIGERNNVFRRTAPSPGDYAGRPARPAGSAGADRRLYFVSHGVVASFDRSEYLQTRSGVVLQAIPPNTVFHLGLPSKQPGVAEAADASVPGRLERRVSRQVAADDFRPDEPAYAGPLRLDRADPPARQAKSGADVNHSHYHALIKGQRLRVVGALQRLSGPQRGG